MSEAWTQVFRDKIAGLLRDGMSAKKIGAIMGVSRNSIIGLVRRDKDLSAIGFKNGGFKVVPRVKPPVPRKNAGITATLIHDRIEQRRIASKPVPIVEIFDGARIGPGVPLMALQRGQCKYPVNDAHGGDPHLFCAAPVLPVERGRSLIRACYCAAHQAVVVMVPSGPSAAAKTIGMWGR